MHGHYENITKVNLLLTEPLQVSEMGQWVWHNHQKVFVQLD